MSKFNEDDLNAWHRHVAVETNNRAWQLTTLPRTTDQDLELLDVAHSSAFHWNIVGNELNRMRVVMLLAEVHALLGFGESAFRYAEQMRSYFLTQSDTPDWELAFVHAIHAHAAHTSSNDEQHRESYLLAKQALNDIADEEDRKVVSLTFEQVPKP